MRSAACEIVKDASLSLARGRTDGVCRAERRRQDHADARAGGAVCRAKAQIEIEGRPLDGMSAARTRAHDRLSAAGQYLPLADDGRGHRGARPLSAWRSVRAADAGRSRRDRATRSRRPRSQDFAHRAVTTLSGGERARVALARALATQAPNPAGRRADRVARCCAISSSSWSCCARPRSNGGGVLAVVHDLSLAARFADRVLVIAERAHRGAGRAGRRRSIRRGSREVFGVETKPLPSAEQTRPVRAPADLRLVRSGRRPRLRLRSVLSSSSASCRPMVAARPSLTRCATRATGPTATVSPGARARGQPLSTIIGDRHVLFGVRKSRGRRIRRARRASMSPDTKKSPSNCGSGDVGGGKSAKKRSSACAFSGGASR